MKRLREMEQGIQKLVERYKQQQEHSRRRYYRQYEDRIRKRRANVLKRFALIEPKGPTKPPASMTTTVKKEMAVASATPTMDEASTPTTGQSSSTPPKKHGTGEKKSEDSHHHHSSHHHHHHGRSSSMEKFHSLFHVSGGDAIQRQKRRKAILSSQPVVLQVEVHNEGIVIMPRTLDSDSKNRQDREEPTDDPRRYFKFIPWGVRSRAFLHSIVCGQIPEGFGWDEIPYAGSLQAGQVRCMVTDMRTSEAAAAAQRATAVKEQNIARTKSNLTELKHKAQEAKKAATEAEKQSQLAAQEGKDLIEKLTLAAKEQVKAQQILATVR